MERERLPLAVAGEDATRLSVGQDIGGAWYVVAIEDDSDTGHTRHRPVHAQAL
jgi:hypothetical protein